jgi:EmrB/QacA subfamily drug resistance transporter
MSSNIAQGLSTLPKKQVIFTMAGVMLAMFLGSLDQTIVGTAMPRIIADLHGFAHYTWVTTAYIISSAVVIPIVGKLTDMYGRKPFYIAGLIIFTIFSLLSGLSQTMLQIIICRGLQGIGAGVMMANAFTVIGDLFPPAQRGKYQGLISGVFGLSAIIGPSLGGFITDALSWHWIFFVNVPLGILVIVLFLFFFPHYRPGQHRYQVDYLGMALLCLAVVPLLIALSFGGTQWAWASPASISLFGLASIMTILFVWCEKRASEPIIPISLYRNRIVALSQIVVFFTAFGMFGSIIFIPLFFQGVLGASATLSGSYLTPMMLGQVIGSFSSGQLLSRGGRYRLLGAAGIAIMAIGMLLTSRMTPATSYTLAIVDIIIIGFGLGITMPLYTIICQNAVPYRMLGVATSSIPFVRSIGGSVALALFGTVLNNSFASRIMAQIPVDVKSAIPDAQLNALVQNPQALVDPSAQAQLQAQLAHLGLQGQQLFQELMSGLKGALSSSVSAVFMAGFIIVAAGFFVHLLIQEIPLRKHHHFEEEGDKACVSQTTVEH